MVESNRQFSLRHIKHETKLNNTLYSMLLDENLVDVILCCESTNIRAHRLILSANSSYFKTLFDSLESNRCQIPVIVLKDVSISDLKAILEFMYRGEVSVEERHLSSVLQSAELLKVFGLTEVCHSLRLRLNNELNNEKSTPLSSGSPFKRARISDTTNQMTPNIFSRISNARFEIRPNISIPSSSLNPTTDKHLTPVVGTTIASKTPTICKNVILPSSQIHRKKVQIESDSTPIETSVEPIVNTCSKSPNLLFTQNLNQSPNVETINLNRGLTSTWTPQSSQQNSIESLISLPSSSQTAIRSPVELLIDDETNDVFEDTDIKPPIFELNKCLNNNERNDFILNIENNSTAKESPKDVPKDVPKDNPKKITLKLHTNIKEKSNPKFSSHSLKSRSSSISSQSPLPPPPSYLQIQRSGSRLLRNKIKPTAAVSTAIVSKTKDISEEKNKLNVKKERQSVRLFRQKLEKSETDSNKNCEESSPEIECPSCGLKFNDDNKWNEHISSVHLSLQT